MSSSVANVGEAKIALSFDDKGIKSGLATIAREMSTIGQESGSKFGDAWTVAVGNLMQKGISKVMSMVSSNIDNAISRVDTLNNFPKVMTNLGVSGEDAASAISKMSDKLQGLPTNLDQGASAVQRFTSKNGDVNKSTDMFLALNNALLAGGQSTDIQASALEQLSQAYAKGKPDMQEWRSAMMAMPAQLKQIAIAMGYGEDGAEALGEALRSGDVTMDDFMSAISKLNTEGVGDFKSFEQQAKDSTGGIQTAIAVMNSRITQGIAAVIDEIGSENIAGIAEGIGNAIKEVGKAVAGVVKFVAENWNIIGPILATLATIAGIIAGINVTLKAYNKVQTALNAVHKASVKVISTVSGGFKKLGDSVNSPAIEQGASKIGNTFKGLKDAITGAIRGIGEILKTLVQAITEPLKVALKGIGEALAGFFQALASPAVLMGAVGFAVVAASIAAAIWLIGSAVGAIMPTLTDLFNNIVMPIAQFIANTLLNLVGAVTNAVVILTQSALIPLGEFLTSAFVTILTTISNVITNLTQYALIPLINTLSGAFINIVQTVANLLTGVLNVALQGIAEIVRAVGDGFIKMGQAIKTALDGVAGILNAFAEMIRSIASAAVAIVSLVTGRSINYGSGYAHLFAKGGRVEGPGTQTSDSIPAMLSDGEYVINAQAARGIGYDTLDALNEGNYYSLAGLTSDFEANYSGKNNSGGGVIIEKQEFIINNEMDAQDIGRVLMESIRRAV